MCGSLRVLSRERDVANARVSAPSARPLAPPVELAAISRRVERPMQSNCLERGRPAADAIAAAVSVLRRGGVVAFPTDTLYGLAVDPRVRHGGRAAVRIERTSSGGRGASHCRDIEQAPGRGAGGSGTPRCMRLLARTAVDRRRGERSISHDGLWPAASTVAIRVPAHAIARRAGARRSASASPRRAPIDRATHRDLSGRRGAWAARRRRDPRCRTGARRRAVDDHRVRR